MCFADIICTIGLTKVFILIQAVEHYNVIQDIVVPDTKPPKKGFVPKVSPMDYQRFIYKCHQCLLGFKRRGMLVNHLAKRHPEQKPDSIPELTLPILRTQRDFFCQYCDKVC